MTTTFNRRFLAALLLGSALLGGCGAATSSTGSAPAAAGGAARDNAVPAEAGAKAPEATTNARTAPNDNGTITDNRLLSRTAAMTIQVADVPAAAARLRVIAAGLGGIVSAENVVVADAGGYAKPSTLVIVVPAERLDAALEQVAAVGTVKLRTVNTTDVTTQVADVDARIRTQRESIARLQELIKKAGTVAEVAQVEGELTRRQAELESLLARQKALSAQVAQSPITLTLLSPTTPVQPTEEPPGFMLGLKRGWAAFTAFIGLLALAAGGFLPFAVFFGVIGAATWFIVRKVQARRRANRPDPVWPSQSAQTPRSAPVSPARPTPPAERTTPTTSTSPTPPPATE